MGCDHTSMPTTRRFMVTVMSTTLQSFPHWSRHALTTSTNGWNRVAYNSIQTNRKSFGLQPAVVVTSAHLRRNDWISPSSSVRDLGVFLDSDLTMQAHVGHITCMCFMMLRQIRAGAAHLPSFATKALVTSLVLSKLDYCNSVMVGLPKTPTRCLQWVNWVQRQVICGNSSCGITSMHGKSKTTPSSRLGKTPPSGGLNTLLRNTVEHSFVIGLSKYWMHCLLRWLTHPTSHTLML